MKLKNPLLLLLAAIIWGVAFVAQKVGISEVPPFMFNAMRSFIGFIVLIPIIALLGKKAPQPQNGYTANRKTLIIGGVLCGTALSIATAFQQYGLYMGADAGKAGFITAMYIVLVPLFGIFLKKPITLKMALSVLIAVIGLYLLCFKGGFTITIGDILVLCCAFVFSVHILVIDHFSPKVECVKMSCIQFLVCGVISLILSFATGETTTVSQLLSAWIPILYLGLLSSGVGYTLQIVAQRDTNPTVASMIMSLESVFAVLAGTIYGEKLSAKEIIGCIIMFGAIILSQLPERKHKKQI